MQKQASKDECTKMVQHTETCEKGAVAQRSGARDSELSADLQKRHHARQNDVQRYVSYRLRSHNQKSIEAEIKVPHAYANR